MNPKLWVCVVRRQVFVGGESQRCRHAETCENCGGRGLEAIPEVPDVNRICPRCNGSGQVSECGVMELIGGEPIEWCVTHGANQESSYHGYCYESGGLQGHCQFESQIRVAP